MERADVYEEIVELLNEITETSPNAMNALMQNCVPVDKELENHPYVTVHARTEESTQCVLRMLGILNGVVRQHGYVICAEYEENEDGVCGDLVGFDLRELDQLSQ